MSQSESLTENITSLHFNETEIINHETFEFNCDAGFIETLTPEAQKRFENLGLENLYFKTHTRENLNFDQLKEKVKTKEANVYFLLHGWTGTNEIFDKVQKPPYGQTIVEEILANDPNAVIICVDGDGFGKTKFKPMSHANLIDKCGPDGYANQIEFAINDIFEIPQDNRDNIYAMGHSLGGATVTVMAGKGLLKAENCVAVCPALLPKEDGETKIRNIGHLRKVKRQYDFLSTVIGAAEIAKHLGPKLAHVSEESVKKVAELLLFAQLTGADFAGTIADAQFEQIIENLSNIHIPEILKTEITSAVMSALSRGVDLSKLDIQKVSQVEIISGQEDKLAPPFEASLIIAHEKDAQDNLLNKQKGSVITLEQEMQNPEAAPGSRVIPKAGHIAVLYDGSMDSPTSALLRKVYSNRKVEWLFNG